jgi:hypothetical protein
LDPFYPKQTSVNVVATQKPSGTITRRLVLNAHPDAAYEWVWLQRSPRWFPVLLYCSLGSLLAVFAIDILLIVLRLCESPSYPGWWFWLGVFQLSLLPGGLIGVFFTNFRQVSPGANDNLSGVFLAVGLAKYLHETSTRLANTELVFLITGAEEAGLRGAKAFVRQHQGQWNDVPTAVITLDTIRDLEHLHVYDRDRNGTVRHDQALCDFLRDVGQRCARPLGSASIYLGSSDAAAFTLGGIRSAALCAMDPAPADYYHNRRDHWTNMSPECIRKTIEIILQAVHDYDRHGIEAESRGKA